MSLAAAATGRAAQLPDLPEFTPKKLSRLSRASRLALPAAREALADAGVAGRSRTVVFGAVGAFRQHHRRRYGAGEQFLRAMLTQQCVSQQFFRVARYQSQNQVHDLHQYLGFRGPFTIVANACASGANAIGHGADLIRSAGGDCMLVAAMKR